MSVDDVNEPPKRRRDGARIVGARNVDWPDDLDGLAASRGIVAPAPDPRPALEPSPELLRACAATQSKCVRCQRGYAGPLGLCVLCLGVAAAPAPSAVGPLPKKVYPMFCSCGCGAPAYCKGMCERCYKRARRAM